jgi:hypothetical protein
VLRELDQGIALKRPINYNFRRNERVMREKSRVAEEMAEAGAALQ